MKTSHHTLLAAAGALTWLSLTEPARSAPTLHPTQPLSFETNTGQSDPEVRFLSRGPRSTLFLTSGGSTLVVRSRESAAAVRMALVAAQAQPRIDGLDLLPGKVHSFVGSDRAKWHTDIATYGRVAYRETYPGIDLIYHGRQGKLEYDFVVAPGADPRLIRLRFDGAEKIEIDDRGDLVLHTAGGSVRQLAPFTYQDTAEGRRNIPSEYTLHENNEVGFKVADYDRTQPLTIDPVLWYSTYWGAEGTDAVTAINRDGSGNLYITGTTNSTIFPRTTGSLDLTLNGGTDAFVSKFSATASNAETPTILYSTYLGGSANDEGRAIATDSNGNAYVTGKTESANFPTASPFQPSRRGPSDAFVTKLNATGSALVYSTYLGSTSADEGNGISVSLSQAFVTGAAGTADFPTTTSAFQRFSSSTEAFITRFNTAGTGLVYSSLLGTANVDTGTAIDSLSSGVAFITGFTSASSFFPTKSSSNLPPFRTFSGGAIDAFVAKFDTDSSGANSLTYSTYLGGSQNDFGLGIIVDSFERAHVVGISSSPNFPQKSGTAPIPNKPLEGSADAFITKLNADGTTIFYSLLIGGNGEDRATGVGFDKTGVWMGGTTSSSDFDVSDDALDATLSGGTDAWIGKIVPQEVLGHGGFVIGTAFRLGYASYFGGSGSENGNGLAVLSSDVHLGGTTTSGFGSGFPVLNAPLPFPVGGQEGFVAKIGRVDQAPEVSCAVSKSSLWPPNSALHNVGLQITATDDTDPAPVVKVSVFSDETDVDFANGGVASPDAIAWAAGTLQLRAERKGSGDGRVYLILVTATDAAGNTGYACCTVTVPHSQSAKAKASVAAQAAAAEAECAGGGGAPATYLLLTPVPVAPGAR
jgi:hypothetical protein